MITQTIWLISWKPDKLELRKSFFHPKKVKLTNLVRTISRVFEQEGRWLASQTKQFFDGTFSEGSTCRDTSSIDLIYEMEWNKTATRQRPISSGTASRIRRLVLPSSCVGSFMHIQFGVICSRVEFIFAVPYKNYAKFFVLDVLFFCSWECSPYMLYFFKLVEWHFLCTGDLEAVLPR